MRILLYVVCCLLLASCAAPAEPSAPGALGQATADWYADPAGKLFVEPERVEIAEGESVQLDITIANQDYIFGTGYIWDGNQWNAITYDGTNQIVTGWFSGSASHTTTLDLSTFPEGTYYVAAYGCNLVNNAFDCNGNKWMIQSFEVVEATISPPPVCPIAYEPVCGVDEVTYGNSCQAEAAGIRIDYQGECTTDNQDVEFEQIIIEAESGNNQGFTNNGNYITSQGGSSKITYNFASTYSDTYYVWAKVSADVSNDLGSDSLKLAINGGTTDIYDFSETDSGTATDFFWEQVSLRCGGSFDTHNCNPYTVDLSPGQNTLVIDGREAKAKVDKFVFTNDPNFNPEDTTEEEPTEDVYACGDEQDNDGDGLIDMQDPGCSSTQDNDEFNRETTEREDGTLGTTSSITQFGITWTFDKAYPYGKFANGDYWVVGPVTITNIDPKDTDGRSPHKHGSVINIGRGSDENGFDNRMSRNEYKPEKDVAKQFPFNVASGSSLISSRSFDTTKARRGDNKLAIEDIAVLTILKEAAPVGSFRPPYQGDDKELRWNVADVDFSKLASVARPSSAPTLANIEKRFERPWMEYNTGWTGRYTHAWNNQDDYGREIGYDIADAANSLQLDYSIEEKQTLAIRFIQYGIDVYGSARLGAKWHADGGHNVGRKVAITIAGVLLNDQDILSYADGSKMIFQDDQQTFYVTQQDIERTTSDRWDPDLRGGTPRAYNTDDLGMAEWGIRHWNEPYRDNAAWSAYYRTIAGAPTFETAVAAEIMGIENEWNHNAFFDYYLDRYWDNEKDRVQNSPNKVGTFAADLYRQEIEPYN